MSVALVDGKICFFVASLHIYIYVYIYIYIYRIHVPNTTHTKGRRQMYIEHTFFLQRGLLLRRYNLSLVAIIIRGCVLEIILEIVPFSLLVLTFLLGSPPQPFYDEILVLTGVRVESR